MEKFTNKNDQMSYYAHKNNNGLLSFASEAFDKLYLAIRNPSWKKEILKDLNDIQNKTVKQMVAQTIIDVDDNGNPKLAPLTDNVIKNLSKIVVRNEDKEINLENKVSQLYQTYRFYAPSPKINPLIVNSASREMQ